jgi:tellurite resistance protein
MSYWPSYHDISPEARAAYLQWLASGKCDPDADIGYVFLYFYGLERRALSLSVPDVKNSQELSTIENEISRLLAIYEKNPSFRGYAYSLLDFMAAKKGRVPSVEELSAAPPPRKGWTLPLDLRIGLGLFAGAHRPLPAEWAFCWYQCTSGLLKSEVASSKVLPALFKLQYEERFGHGINLPAANTRITLVHKAASMSFGASSYSAAIELPDITTLSGPAESLKEVGRTCLGIISPYRRAMENSSGRENSIAVFSLLPPGLWPAEIRDGLARMRSSIAANGLAQLLRLKDLPGLSADFSGMNKGRFGMFSEQLGKLGLGIEPDTRFGGNLPDPADHVAFFVAGGLEKVQPFSTHYAVTSLLVRLAAMVAVASEGFSDAEASVVLNYLSSEMELPTAEQARLAARLSLYRVAPPNSAGLKKHIEPLNRSARETIGNFLIYVVLAGGNADPSEIRVLESLYKMLGLEQASLYSRIHKVAAQQHLPKPTPFTNDTVRPVEPKKGVLEFDTQKIAALRSESAKVSEILGKVFDDSAEEEEYTPASEKEQIEPAEQALLGLDAEHASLLQVILQRTQWSRAEMEELCADHGLMTDGAMERINEAAFDRLECAILEGEDPIDVNSDLVSKEIA